MEPIERLRADVGPYFFLSYAHTPRDDHEESDPDMWVHRLFRDLSFHIRQMTTVPGGASGFMDRSMRAGQIWKDELAESLASCRVFVPLYSPRYFTSSWCGKEWSAFGRRPTQHRVEGRQGTPSAVVPTLWAPVEDHQLPKSVSAVQYTHPELGDRYRAFGLYGLIKVKSFRGDYEKAVMRLARRIVEVGENVIVERGARTLLDSVPNAFAPVRARRTLRITVAANSLPGLPEGRSPDYYGHSALDWNPFHPECARPLAAVAADIAERMEYRPDLQALDTWDETADGTDQDDGPEVMLLDRWVLRDPQGRARLRQYDMSGRPATGLMVPWNDADPDSDGAEAELAEEAEETLPRTMRSGRQACRPAVVGIPDHESFGALLPRVVQWTATRHLRHTQAQPPPGQATPRFRLSISGEQDSPPPVNRPHAEEEDHDGQP
ncbi:TIR-like protein FxsC [Streptomyces muensis]|uniref:TIR-like protein FxsC n=1 Tax=Streptomyces muensis TaxID=1077944 RepID=A0A9X1PUX4_STRM4|nr:TIR-like protein FxsC [Streptomyces muensis]MCF1592999.1 TIR-like protein FxsC [Streptomyces muensis]